MSPDGRIAGHSVTIYQGVWGRILTFGAPRAWSHAWTGLWLFVGLLILTYGRIMWLALPFCAWLVGHLSLVALTSWNPKWDDMMRAQLTQGYKDSYRAG